MKLTLPVWGPRLENHCLGLELETQSCYPDLPELIGCLEIFVLSFSSFSKGWGGGVEKLSCFHLISVFALPVLQEMLPSDTASNYGYAKSL